MDAFLAIVSKRDTRAYASRPIPEDVVTRLLEAGRVAGSAMNRQPWTFVVVEQPELRERLADAVYVPDNVRGAALVVVLALDGGAGVFDAGRAAQNMMLAAWNEGVASCPNGMPDPALAAEALGLEESLRPQVILTFGYPAREREPGARAPEEWIAQADRKPLAEVVRHGSG